MGTRSLLHWRPGRLLRPRHPHRAGCAAGQGSCWATRSTFEARIFDPGRLARSRGAKRSSGARPEPYRGGSPGGAGNRARRPRKVVAKHPGHDRQTLGESETPRSRERRPSAPLSPGRPPARRSPPRTRRLAPLPHEEASPAAAPKANSSATSVATRSSRPRCSTCTAGGTGCSKPPASLRPAYARG